MMDEAKKYTDDYLTVVLKKAEIVLSNIKSTRMNDVKEKEH